MNPFTPTEALLPLAKRKQQPDEIYSELPVDKVVLL